MRKAEAYWMEKYNRWQIVAYRCGVRRSFYSGKPGKLGKHEAEAKADKWLKTFIPQKKRMTRWMRGWQTSRPRLRRRRTGVYR